MTERTDSVSDGSNDLADRDAVARETYEPDQEGSLTDALLDAIVRCKGEDFDRTDFALFEDLDSEALEDLFRDDAEPRTRTTIESGDVRIELWADGGVEIRVEDRSDG